MHKGRHTRALPIAVGITSLFMLQLFMFAAPAVGFTPPPDKPRPPRGSTGSGGSRRDLPCATQAQQADYSPGDSVQVLTPAKQIGYTAAAHPTFMAYLPATSANQVVLTLRDVAKRTHSRTLVPISGQAGWVTLSLPKHAPALNIDQDYEWFLTIKCYGQLRPSSPFVEGWVRRVHVPSTIRSHLSQPLSLTKADALGAASLWYDTAATLGQLLQQKPNDAKVFAAWQKLLTWTEFAESEIVHQHPLHQPELGAQ